jgi:hypothetical protein
MLAKPQTVPLGSVHTAQDTPLGYDWMVSPTSSQSVSPGTLPGGRERSPFRISTG